MLAARCRTADSFLSRAVGLIGRARLADDEGLVITKTNAITMVFMRFGIDAVFIDRGRRVVRIAPRLRPWWPATLAFGADAVVELPAGAAARSGTQVGDVLRFE
ncbi:MAG: DUF192 domain-containing protein [Chloroflexota bacterium]|nr:DUF192 domain-containing protein [Chloroflexota bacterium]